MTDTQYEAQELRGAQLFEQRLEKAPLADRQAAKAEYADDATNRQFRIAMFVEYLLAGHYGKGPLMVTERATMAMNRVSLFAQLIAVFEYQCTRDAARKVYRAMDKDKQEALDVMVGKVIANWDQKRAEDGKTLSRNRRKA